jgi:hypothetical protein
MSYWVEAFIRKSSSYSLMWGSIHVNKGVRKKRQATEVSGRGKGATLTGLLSGSFDGSPVQLRYDTTINDGKITALKSLPK